MIRINEIENPKKRILFLGFDQSKTRLIDALTSNRCLVDHTENKIEAIRGYDLVISYGYRHIINRDVINRFPGPIFNLHVSYLPYNRGAHPNFWSFYDDTPKGISIHLIDSGVDTGPIVRQQYVNFSESDDTFAKTYAVLNQRIETLFIELLPSLLSDTWDAKPQKGKGTHHYSRDLPSNFSGWDSNIEQEIQRLNQEGFKYE